MPPVQVLFAVVACVVFGAGSGAAQPALGPQGAEGEPWRMQQWLLPSPDLGPPSHAVLFRPPGEGPFPLAVIAHATTQNVLRRAQMLQPEYRALSAWLVARGYAVLVPERPGHGATGGKYLEDQGGCDEADYARSGRTTADVIAASVGMVRKQPFIRPDDLVLIGHSAGGWGALAVASKDPQDVAAIVVFAPGRGGHANDLPNRICAPHTLIAAASEFGQGGRIKVTWLVAANDSYFSPAFSKQMADAFRAAGGKVDFVVLAAIGSEGHWLPETEAGVKLASPTLDRALKLRPPPPARKR